MFSWHFQLIPIPNGVDPSKWKLCKNHKDLLNYINTNLGLSKKSNKPYTDKSEIISEYIPQEEIKNLIQEDLPFIKAEKIKESEKNKFKIPDLDLLKMKEKNLIKMEDMNQNFLKKYY